MFSFNKIIYLGILTYFANNVHFIMEFWANVSEMLDGFESKVNMLTHYQDFKLKLHTCRVRSLSDYLSSLVYAMQVERKSMFRHSTIQMITELCPSLMLSSARQ